MLTVNSAHRSKRIIANLNNSLTELTHKIRSFQQKTKKTFVIRWIFIDLQCGKHWHRVLFTFLCNDAEIFLQFDVVTGAVDAVSQTCDRGLKISQLRT